MARFLACALSIPVSSCALIGKAPKSVVDFRESGYDGHRKKIWSERYVITGTATKAHADGSVGYFIKPDWKARRENISYKWPVAHPEIELQPETRYLFHMITHFHNIRDSMGDRTYKHSEVERIQTLDGVTILDASRCPIHKTDMRWDWEESNSTEDYYNTPFFAIRKNKFPYDGSVYLPCGSGYYREKRWICGKCEIACDQMVKKLGIIRY